ncbi:ATP-binding protein [Actinoallomurus sp. CA-142502]|uniref:ATP-binding protein n=1 Tax=Actinoallomurus sp. CA-142502 TaxID=3239885 RepID=UPI003D904806
MEFGDDGVRTLFVKDATAPGEARTWVAAYFLAHGRADVIPDARILVSELVTNALREEALFEVNGGAAIGLTITRGPLAYRVGVYDGNPDPPPAPPEFPALDAEAGRGLVLVAAIATQWGSTPATDPATGRQGKYVWFELPRTASDE